MANYTWVKPKNIRVVDYLPDFPQQDAEIEIKQIAWMPNEESERAIAAVTRGARTGNNGDISASIGKAMSGLRELSQICVKSWNLKDADGNAVPIPAELPDSELKQMPSILFNLIGRIAEEGMTDIPEASGGSFTLTS